MEFKNGKYSYTETDADGVVSTYFYNSNLHSALITAKRERGIERPDSDSRIVEHELTGKRIRRNGKEYTVQNVYKQWWMGYYLMALIRDDNDSHAQMEFENISCMSDIIIESIKENKYEII
jgi:hypothetical protein